MAFRVGVTGLPNTGKSFGWSSYKGDDVFAICPSMKILHTRRSDGSMFTPINVVVEGVGDSNDAIMKAKGFKSEGELLAALSVSGLPKEKIKVTGDYVICSEVKFYTGIKKFVNDYMPDKKIILTTDFTHLINYIMQSESFRNKKAGGEAFQKYWGMSYTRITRGRALCRKRCNKSFNLDLIQCNWPSYLPLRNQLIRLLKNCW